MNERFEIRENLKAWIDGELPPSESEQVRAAVEGDPALAQEVRFLQLMSNEIGQIANDPQVKGQAETVKRVTPRRSAGLPRWVWGVGLVGCLVMGSIGFSLLNLPNAASAPSKAKRAVEENFAGSPASPAIDQFRARKTEVAPSRTSSAPPVLVPDRKVIRNGSLSLVVADVSRASSEASSLAAGAGGYVESSSLGGGKAQNTANLTLRVPENAFESTMLQLSKLGEVLTETKSGNDVTAEVVDLEARARAFHAEEDQYIALLRQANKIGEILEIRERLAQVRQTIESMESQAKSLRGMAAMSSIQVAMIERLKADGTESSGNWAQDAWTRALIGLKGFGKGIATLGIYILVFAPIWVPIALLLAFAWRRAGRTSS